MRQSGIIVLLALALSAPALAGNGVAVSTTHFRFEGDAGSRALIKNLARVAEQKWRYVEQVLGPVDAAPITVVVASTNESMARATGSTHWSRGWIAGVARPSQRHMVLSARGDGFFNVTDTFVHELTHIALRDATAGHPTPLWFQEGVAMLLASEESGERLKTLFSAAATNSLFEIGALSESFPPDPPAVHLAYAQALLFTPFFVEAGPRHGDHVVDKHGADRHAVRSGHRNRVRCVDSGPARAILAVVRTVRCMARGLDQQRRAVGLVERPVFIRVSKEAQPDFQDARGHDRSRGRSGRHGSAADSGTCGADARG